MRTTQTAGARWRNITRTQQVRDPLKLIAIVASLMMALSLTGEEHPSNRFKEKLRHNPQPRFGVSLSSE